ncbi:hypothetical protein HYW20_04385 [Candidatus Woesearchaeota archaeon]|nr:hypothetical protein [Candidatus Woesearchaeota archaeon]
MKEIIFVAIVALLLNLGLANAITQQEIKEAKNLIDSRVDCKSLSDSQLEIIGEYEMELMHSGESHELMHKMMGIKEGSEAEKQFHINMAKMVYCNENTGGMMGAGMMNGGMMNMMMGGNRMSYGSTPYGYGFGYWNFLNVLYIILFIGLIILVYLWIIKLWKSMKDKKDKHKK